MFTSFSEIDDNTKLRVLIAWKGRVLMEKDKKYRKDEELNKIYSTFCNVVHGNNPKLSTFKLRLLLIKILNDDKSFLTRLKNYRLHLFSDTLSIPEIDIEKIVKAWRLRTMLEKNKKYFHSYQIKNIYEHLSNILHGEMEKHDMNYINECETKVQKFFEKTRNLYFYQLQGRQTTLDLKKVDKLKKKRIMHKNKMRKSKVFFYKSPFKGTRIAFIENDPDRIEELKKHKYIILKHKTNDIGVFEFVDSTTFYTLVNAKKFKRKTYYQLYYK
jgi:hypothetical protein